MQASVPQFIDVEDRIIGPMTLKQFGYYMGATGLSFIYWLFFDFSLFLSLAILTFLLATVFAFFKINDRPFIYFLLAVVSFYVKAPVRIWNRRGSRLKPQDMIAVSFREEGLEETGQKDIVKAHMKRGRLSHLEKALETA